MKKLHVMSFNLRVDVKNDGANAWPFRKKDVIQFILKEMPDVLGIQETNPKMLEELKFALIHVYDFIVEPRDQHGESTPLLIKKGLGKYLIQKTVWLTDTPEVPSSIPHSNHPRITSYVIMEIDEIGHVGIFNTHLDYTGDHTTMIQVKHLQTYIEKLNIERSFKTIIMGDFNSYPETQTIQYLKAFYHDGYKEDQHQLTFHNFTKQISGKPIDYIFYDHAFEWTEVHIVNDKEAMLSDHYPIKCYISLKQ